MAGAGHSQHKLPAITVRVRPPTQTEASVSMRIASAAS
jgi:hypothetical protein